MAFGIPDVGEITAEFRDQFGQLLAMLTEIRDLLRQIRDQRDMEQNGPRG